MLEDGSVEVLNKGYQDTLDGELNQVTGNATIWDEETNSKLKVVFPGAPDLPYPNYLIVVLDEAGYEYAAVTDPFEYTLFILSRSPKMSENTYSMILGQLEALGVDTSELVITRRHCPWSNQLITSGATLSASAVAPLCGMNAIVLHHAIYRCYALQQEGTRPVL